MAEDDTKYADAYEANDADGIGTAVLYPIIAAVFSTFCILSIVGFLLSNRKCCKPKHKDAESTILKQHLVAEQKRMSKYHFKFPLGDHPSFTSCMQQEENEIAEEVKECYKSISLNINKPIICCPQHKMSYTYNPKEICTLSHTLKSQDTIIHCLNEQDEVCHQEIPTKLSDESLTTVLTNKSARNVKLVESEGLTFIEKNVEKQDPDPTKGHINTLESKINLFTPSEIELVDDIKSLYFKKWLQQAEVLQHELNSESVYNFERLDLSYDDIESILTSISRMDSGRVKKLKETKFYQNLLNNMEVPPLENIEDDNSIDSIDLNELDEYISSKTGQQEKHLSLTHDEIMNVLVEDNEHEVFKTLDEKVQILNYQEKCDFPICENTQINDIQKSNMEDTNNTKINDIQKSNMEDINNTKINDIQKSNMEDINNTKIKCVSSILSNNSKLKSGTLVNTRKPKTAPSESLFKPFGKIKTLLSEKSKSLINSYTATHSSQDLSETQISDSSFSELASKTELDNSLTETSFSKHLSSTPVNTSYTTSITRPTSLDLRYKNTELSLESNSNHTKTNIGSNNSVTCSSSCSSKSSSYITTWQQIYASKKQDKRSTTRSTGNKERKDENLNVISKSKESLNYKVKKHKNTRHSMTSDLSTSKTEHSKNTRKLKQVSKQNKVAVNLSRSFSFFESNEKRDKVKESKLRGRRHIRTTNTTFDTSDNMTSQNRKDRSRSIERKEILWKYRNSGSQSSDVCQRTR